VKMQLWWVRKQTSRRDIRRQRRIYGPQRLSPFSYMSTSAYLEKIKAEYDSMMASAA
jgi:hypothetical protein